MNTTSILVVLGGLLIRLAVPLAVTALVVLVLRRLDTRWQAQAEQERKDLVKDEAPCWREQGLPIEQTRVGSEKLGRACWQTHRLSNGYLREICLDCDVFLTAPIPASKHSPAQV